MSERAARSRSAMRSAAQRYDREAAADAEPMTCLGAAGACAARSAAGAQPFVGRRPELAMILAALDRCTSSRHGRAIVVRGEAGIGKTRLVERGADCGARTRRRRALRAGVRFRPVAGPPTDHDARAEPARRRRGCPGERARRRGAARDVGAQRRHRSDHIPERSDRRTARCRARGAGKGDGDRHPSARPHAGACADHRIRRAARDRSCSSSRTCTGPTATSWRASARSPPSSPTARSCSS